jgi:hypothetical protein
MGGLLLITSSVLKNILGYIPAEILNEINISGEIILLSGIILSTRRIRTAFQENRPEQIFITLLSFLMAVLGIVGGDFVIYFWLVGLFLLALGEDIFCKVKRYLFLSNFLEFVSKNKIFNYIIFLCLTLPANYLLLPLNWINLLMGAIILIYFQLRPGNWNKYRWDIIYLALFLGLLASRTGLLS